MKIVISDSGREWRGTESVTWIFAQGFHSRGHDILVLCVPGSPLHERLSHAGLPHAAILGGGDLDPRVLIRCWRSLRRFRPDIVITQKDKDLRWTGLCARLQGIPVLVRHVTDRPLKRSLRYRFFFGWVATHHVANSAATKATSLASAPWLHNHPISIVHNGVDVKAIRQAQPATLPVPDDAIVIAFAGHFEVRKGILDFAKAWIQVSEAIPNAHAVIVGNGPREPQFRAALSGAPRVHWLGFRKDLTQILKSVDIFVMPSHFEGFGIVLAEAMAAGVACIAYEVSNLPEVISNEVDGLLVPARDPEALARAVIRLAGCPELRERLARNAQRKSSTEFTAERMVSEYEAIAAHATRSR